MTNHSGTNAVGMLYDRYQEVQKENDALRETVNKLQDLMESNRNEHGTSPYHLVQLVNKYHAL
jgi:hypothetical protein